MARSLVKNREQIKEIQLHAFDDASGKGVSTVVCALVHQPSSVSQGLVASKSRLAKQALTILGQELVSAHMSTNLVHNVKEISIGFAVTGVYGWLDSTVALQWVNGNGACKEFVKNRVKKIQEKQYIQWRHVPTAANPADLGSHGGTIEQLSELWRNGPTWLQKPESWPPNVITSPTRESESEAKIVREVLKVAVAKADVLDDIMEQCRYWKAVRITAWIARFLHNCKKRAERANGPLTLEKLEFWIKRAQDRCQETKEFLEDQQRLNLQKNHRGLYEGRGRNQGGCPVYLPKKFNIHRD